jgi:hypothetical protein
MNRTERAQSTEEIFAELLARALAAGLWDGVEFLRPCDLGVRLPLGFCRSSDEAAAVGRDNFRPRMPALAAPCDAPPGSRAKIDVLAARVDAGEELWHPRDAGWEEEGLGIGELGIRQKESSQSLIPNPPKPPRHYQRPRKSVGRRRKKQHGNHGSKGTRK